METFFAHCSCQLDQGRTRSRIPNGRVAILSHDGDVILTPRAGIPSEHELANKYWRNSIDMSTEISWRHLKKSTDNTGGEVCFRNPTKSMGVCQLPAYPDCQY